jgi:hypothetical protein
MKTNMRLMRASTFRLPLLAGLAVAAVLVAALIAPSTAAAGEEYLLPAGTACADFDVLVTSETHPNASNPYREFYDRNGNFVRFFAGGRGDVYTFAVPGTGASFTWKGSGDNVRVYPLADDGTVTVIRTGGYWYTWGPDDAFDPPGPALYIFVGRINFAVDAAFIATRMEFTGKKTDVCAILQEMILGVE